MLILGHQRRASGRAYAGLLAVWWGAQSYVLCLQHHPVGENPWQAALYTTDVLPPQIPPLWRSGRHEAATQAVDALLEYLAPLGLPDDLLPLINELLPDRPVGEPLYQR
jgi:hypothetical protein